MLYGIWFFGCNIAAFIKEYQLYVYLKDHRDLWGATLVHFIAHLFFNYSTRNILDLNVILEMTSIDIYLCSNDRVV